MKRRLVVGFLAALGLLGAANSASAQEIQVTGPLKGAPPVRNLRQYREGRFEVALTPAFTLLDEYRRTIFAAGRLTYNFKDWLGVGVWGGYGAVSITTNLTDQIDQVALRNERTAANVNHSNNPSGGTGPGSSFADQTAKMTWIAAPQLTISPFRGKLAIFQKIFVDTDLYLAGGVAFVGLEERGNCGAAGQPACSDPKSFARTSRTAIAPTFGLGLSLYVTNFFSLGFEYRALPFSWNRAGFDQRGSGTDGKFPDNKIDGEDATFKWNQMLLVGLGFSFPTSPKISE
jgi:outer membrane beta-barrel protein